jgi:hypothetical protein
MILMVIYLFIFALSFAMIGFSFWEFDYKAEKFYEENFAEFRVKYNVSLAQLKKDGTLKGNKDAYWYKKFEKDARDDFDYFSFDRAWRFMFKYWGGMVPEQGVVPQEDNTGFISVRNVFTAVNIIMPIILITTMLNMLIAIMNTSQQKLEEKGASRRFHA